MNFQHIQFLKMNKANSFFRSKLSVIQLEKVQKVADLLQIEIDWLLFVMYVESHFKTTATNPYSGAVGLIQFTRDIAGVNYKTINGKKYYLETIKNMDFNTQMDLVYLYFKSFFNRMSSFTDVYLVVAFPLACGKPDNFVFQTKNLSATIIAQQNPSWNTIKDNQVTKLEFINYIEKRYNEVTGTVVKKKV
jgi:Transglycosylase SLT domain